MKLSGKHALITGASRGMGRAIAEALASEGAHVAVNYLTHRAGADEAIATIRARGGNAFAIQADVSRKSDVERMIDATVRELGGIDILVNNAGVLKRTSFVEIGEEEWDRIFRINVKGYFLVGQAVARQMIAQGRGGSIINISSVAGQLAVLDSAHYCASKAGVIMMTKVMALELGPKQIRVNSIAPGLIETDMNRADLAREEFRTPRLALIPLKTVGKPQDVAGSAVFLASDEARLITGIVLFVDAGRTVW